MRRLLTVGLLPGGLVVVCLWALVRAGSFTGVGDWSRVAPRDHQDMAVTVVVLVSGTLLLTALLQPFQVRAVRVLEGYWDRWPMTSGPAGVLIEVQRRRWEAVRGQAERPAPDAAARRVRADARRRLAATPSVDVLLPTALGNALRAGELSAGERYGLSTLASWPRIYMQVSDRMSDTLRSARDALDSAVNLCWSLLATAVLLVVAGYDESGLRWLAAGALLLAAVAYKGAVIVAQAYSGLMHVVYDLHRFDLLDALHHPLPADDETERDAFEEATARFAGRALRPLVYDHTRERSHADDADHRAHAEDMDRQTD
ncbi:hypothetical protein JCM4814A_22730 [Streptomyces phaeofaciens JCM 4814]|uniref:Uncharacterized protein n=1 Tax=Streptomyces phaeofaciens TaxID=68254 RepID=A0A918H3D1_9ACTN|nr:hypothetical protein [Streptomyces phaeofaciens]GGT34443.1 hypothetical protein GCM10010226_08080 [Streptomyces phaeofaciens]